MIKKYRLIWGILLGVLLILSACNLPSSSPKTNEPSQTLSPSSPTSEIAAPKNTDGAETVFVPGSVFQMGSDETDALAENDEKPAHSVTVNGFYIYTHEVTRGMYNTCAEDGGCLPLDERAKHRDDPAYDDHPITEVDWNMARQYCEWAGARLPTEAEWELAARSLEDFRYPWGNEDPSCSEVNMIGCQTPADTVPVGSFALGNSPYDVWDMSGNVWEWVFDWYAEAYYTFSPKNNPIGPSVAQNPRDPQKTIRGGGWYSQPASLRGAERRGATSYKAYTDVGFRCVVADPLPIPPEYVMPPDRHEGSSGASVEESEPLDAWSLFVGDGIGSCPTEDGKIEVQIPAISSVPTDWDFAINCDSFECEYNASAGVLECTGDMPDDYFEHNPIEGRVGHDALGMWGYEYVSIDHPSEEECAYAYASPYPSLSGDMSLSCPRDGLLTLSISFSESFQWSSVRLDDHELSCVQIDLMHTNCTVPAGATDSGTAYVFHMFGHFPGDDEILPFIGSATIPEDCPSDTLYEIAAACFEDVPSVALSSPTLENVTQDGNPLDCVAMAPGAYYCALQGLPGDTASLELCFAGGACVPESVSVPDCGTGTIPSHPVWSLDEVGCHDEEHYYIIVNTNNADISSGAGYLFYLNQDNFNCEPNPTHAGIIYCSFSIPANSPLTFCTTAPGAAGPVCGTFDDFATRLPETCRERTEPEPTHAPVCADYTDENTCRANNCDWRKGPPDGLEHCYDP
jgi:formylglycine-generating enzyme required for sulfatase activity